MVLRKRLFAVVSLLILNIAPRPLHAAFGARALLCALGITEPPATRIVELTVHSDSNDWQYAVSTIMGDLSEALPDNFDSPFRDLSDPTVRQELVAVSKGRAEFILSFVTALREKLRSGQVTKTDFLFVSAYGNGYGFCIYVYPRNNGDVVFRIESERDVASLGKKLRGQYGVLKVKLVREPRNYKYDPLR